MGRRPEGLGGESGIGGAVGLKVSRSILEDLRSRDQRLARVMDRVGAFTLELEPTPTVFFALLRSIIYQQLHGKAAAAIRLRVHGVLESHGGVRASSVLQTPDQEFRSAGLSGAKILAIRDLADRDLAGKIPTLKQVESMSESELIQTLTQVRGIGPWTVHMLLIFNLGRLDVLPVGDLAVRVAFREFFIPRAILTSDRMIKYARRWQPYRSVATWYLWRAQDPLIKKLTGSPGLALTSSPKKINKPPVGICFQPLKATGRPPASDPSSKNPRPGW